MPSSVSIVIPVYNEEGNIIPLLDEIHKSFTYKPVAYEIILVNDGSTDASADIINSRAKADKHLLPIHLEKNSGQSFAIYEGIKAASKSHIAFLDGDMQNDPADIPAMLELLTQCDVVLGYRGKRIDTFQKRLTSAWGNQLIRWLFGVHVIDAGCSLRVGKAQVFKDIRYFKNYHRYLNIIIKKRGYRTCDYETHHRNRHSGTSKYNMSKIFNVLAEMLYLKSQLRKKA